MNAKNQRPLAPIMMVGPGRLAFAYIFEPKTNEDGKARYETNLLLPPGFDKGPILKALEDEMVAMFGPRAEWPRTARRPEDVVYTLEAPKKNKKGQVLTGFDAGWTVLSAAHQKTAPGVVNAVRDEVTDPSEVYSGRWARLGVRPYAYDTQKGGVSLSLQGVQVLKHDTKFGGNPDAKSMFDEYVEDPTDEDVI